MDEAVLAIDYGAGKLLDVYVPGAPESSVLLLLWHGRGSHDRHVLGPLARRIAAAGVGVVVPGWSTDDGADGRGDLVLSISFARNELTRFMAVDRIVLAGWSLGASAGLDVVLHPDVAGGWRPDGFVGISGGYQDSPFSQEEHGHATADPALPLMLFHGSTDEVVPVERSRVTLQRLRREGWNASLREVATDHAGAIGTVYDPDSHCCVPTSDALRLEALATIATEIAKSVTGD